MTKPASDRLIERANKAGTGSIGISAADIARIPITDEVVAEIVECLSNPDVSELKWGMSFAIGILDSSPPQDFLKWLIPKVPYWLRHENWDVRNRAMEIFIRLRGNYKNYRELMLEMLKDCEPTVRWEALKTYQTFMKRADIPSLLNFQNDDYMSETEMGSPLVYPLRNLALAIIEELCQKQFAKTEKVEMGEAGRMVYWWDWGPFLDWWNKRQSKWRFWETSRGRG